MLRRSFIKKTATAAGLLLAGSFPFAALAGNEKKELHILHTSDLHIGLQHSHWQTVNTYLVEAKSEQSLLLDAGDMFHGAGLMGEAEMCTAMRCMNYDAATLGEHDMDAGTAALAARINAAAFPVLLANYDLSQTVLEHCVLPYHIIYKNGLKIGLFGISAGLETAPAAGAETLRYRDALITAQETSYMLRQQKRCDIVICLSHLGFEAGKINDKILAAETEHIDIIIGGHSHITLSRPAIVLNKKGKETLICHAGWGGEKIGQLIYDADSKKGSKLFNVHSVITTKQTSAV